MAELEPVTEQWTYAGRYFASRDKKIYYVWQLPDGKQLSYSKSKANVVGGLYDVRVSRPEGTTIMHGDPTWTGKTVDDAERAILQAKDRAAYSRQQSLAAEKRHASSGPLEDACQELERIAGRCRSYEDIEALAGVVRRRLINAWDKANR